MQQRHMQNTTMQKENGMEDITISYTICSLELLLGEDEDWWKQLRSDDILENKPRKLNWSGISIKETRNTQPEGKAEYQKPSVCKMELRKALRVMEHVCM